MTLRIEDPKTEEAFRRLAEIRKVSVDEAIRAAAEETLQRDRRNLPVEERLASLHAIVRSLPDTGVKLDKAFYDDLWGESELRGDEE